MTTQYPSRTEGRTNWRRFLLALLPLPPSPRARL